MLFVTIFEQFYFTKRPFEAGQGKTNSSLRTRPLNIGDRLIEVKITVIKRRDFQDFDN